MTDLRFDSLGAGDYDRAKRVFDRAKHPGFIGRELFFRAATTGRAVIAVLEGDDAGVALMAKEKLLALSIVKTAQGRGIGPAIMDQLRPQWVSSIADRIGFFEKIGYVSFGAPKVGANGKHATQLMQRKPDADAIPIPEVRAELVTQQEAKKAIKRYLAPLPALASVRDKLERGADGAVGVMYELLEIGEPREQADAARVLLGAYVQLRKDSPESVNPSLATREARVAHMRAALRDPDDELLESLRAEADSIRKLLEAP